MTNRYCDALGIAVPRLEVAARAAGANAYSMLIVALLERGEPLTLAEVAQRFEVAGIAPAGFALAALKRCRPGRPPIYRDGDRYALDPHADEVDRWVFRLGLRPSRAIAPRPTPLAPHPSPDEPLTVADLDEAWRDGIPNTWSAQRIAICVLDAHRKPMRPEDALAFVSARSKWQMLRADSAQYRRSGSPVRVRADGSWDLDGAHSAVRSARRAVIERIAMVRKWAALRVDPALIEANTKRFEAARAANGERLGRMRRVLIHAFPAARPAAVVLVDVERRAITTLLGAAVASVGEMLAGYEIIAAVGVRALLRALAFDPGERHLAELGPPQKTKRIGRRGRTLAITTKLLVQGSCGISRPFADEAVLTRYLRAGEETKLRRRLEADAKSLFAFYQYGRLHGAVRLRWGFDEEMLPAPWVHRDEPVLYHLIRSAAKTGTPLEVVAGSAPGWEDPWSRAQRVFVGEREPGYRAWLDDEQGFAIDSFDVQLARLAGGRGDR